MINLPPTKFRTIKHNTKPSDYLNNDELIIAKAENNEIEIALNGLKHNNIVNDDLEYDDRLKALIVKILLSVQTKNNRRLYKGKIDYKNEVKIP